MRRQKEFTPMRKDEVDSLVAQQIAQQEAEMAALNTIETNKLIKVLEKLFIDFEECISNQARYCNNNDATAALYEITNAINMLDIPFLVRDALEIPHPEPSSEEICINCPTPFTS